MNKTLILFITVLILVACKETKKSSENKTDIKKGAMNTLSKEINYTIKKNCIIAHRGTTYWAPEETEAAFRWARNIGADYLELDLQLTKDNQLVAFHDDNLQRTTNISIVFPNRVDSPISDFTLEELRRLDVGSWFNIKNPKRARKSFKDLKILTLEDVINIAEGKKLQYHPKTSTFTYVSDTKDNGNRPGIYAETKHPKSNIEKYLAKELTVLGWNINTHLKEIPTKEGKVAIANTNARLILQSFSPQSIQQLEKYLPNIPKCFLLWKPNMKGDLKGVYQKAIDFSLQNNVQIIGSSIAGAPNNYGELTSKKMVKKIHNKGLLVHPYTFDTEKQFLEYSKRIEGVFTNRADLALKFYQRKKVTKPSDLLIKLGY